MRVAKIGKSSSEDMESEEQRAFEIRSLTGESTTVSISRNKTVQDLKDLLLKSEFQPALEYPNSHFYFKGTKLNLQSQLDFQADGGGNFVVIIPFIKKEKRKVQQCGDPVTVEEKGVGKGSSGSDLAWQDMMNDVSQLRDVSNEASQRTSKTGETGSGVSFETSGGEFDNLIIDKTHEEDVVNREEEIRDNLILTVLESPSKDVLLGQNSKALIRVLEMGDCLPDWYSGDCKFRFLSGCTAVCEEKNKSSCKCPPWLKAVLKGFAFLNIISAYLQQRREETTWNFLTEVLDDLAKSGLQIGVVHLDHLSILCPKVVRFENVEEKVKPDKRKIIVYRGPQTERNGSKTKPRRAQRQVPISTLLIELKRRERSFKTTLLGSIASFMISQEKGSKNRVLQISLEDLCKYVKEGINVNGQMKKPAKRKRSSSSAKTYCREVQPLSASQMIEHLRQGTGCDGQMVHIENIAARKAKYVNFPKELSDNIILLIQRLGIDKLYSHQAESIKSSLAGRNVVVATMTSSGKSLCYNLPVLEALSKDLSSCALYLFPTKALAQDQLRAFLSTTDRFAVNFNVGIYDGDTSRADRMWLRDHSRLLITNPDMLHMSILPYHGQFERFLSNLRFVVIDEAHAYKGAFGCHTALILRRLRRLCSHVYGISPSFVLCTATLANPREHVMELVNLQSLDVIQNDGSPSSEKFFILWNPAPSVKPVQSSIEGSPGCSASMDQNEAEKRPSSILDVSRLFAEMVQHGLRSIAFCRSRKLCELVLCYTREILEEISTELADSICSYRGGYTAEDRRRIESDFFGGKLRGIAATNALELGVDVGHIDVTLHLGFPGSIASLWQQAGRAGRRGKPALAIYVAFQDPLDQFFMKFPQKLFTSPIECCHVDSQNQQVLSQHLACAALECPLHPLYDEKYFGLGIHQGISLLREKGYLTSDLSRESNSKIWTYIGRESKPSQEISIRAIETERYKVLDKLTGELLEDIEESRAFYQVYEGAVYMNQGSTYLVKELDVSNKIARCQRADVKYYTQPRSYTDVHVIGGEIAYPSNAVQNQSLKTTARAEKCKVTTTWFGFRRILKRSNVVIEEQEFSLPTFSFESQAAWIRVPLMVKKEVNDFRGGLHAACHAILNVVPLYVMCNLSDLSPECANPHDERYFPERILVYDKHPGGTGIAAQIQPFFTELLKAALDLLMACSCSRDVGCPYCIQSMACQEYNEVLHKESAIKIIKAVLDAEMEHFEPLSK